MAEFYSARGWEIPPLPWTNLSPPFSRSAVASKLCLEFLILTAARSGEARGARWQEIDAANRLWIVPASRMKSGTEHRVPLADRALEILTNAREISDGSDLIFPSPARPGHALSGNALTKVLRSAGLVGRSTTHGFRTNFRT